MLVAAVGKALTCKAEEMCVIAAAAAYTALQCHLASLADVLSEDYGGVGGEWHVRRCQGWIGASLLLLR